MSDHVYFLVSVGGFGLAAEFTAHLPRGAHNYQYSWLLTNVFGRYDVSVQLAAWIVQSAEALEYNRMSAHILNLLRRCRFEGELGEMRHVDRFWIAVYMKAHYDGETYDVYARRYRVVRSQLYAAVSLHLLPSEFEYYAPMDYVQMLRYAGMNLDRRNMMFMQLSVSTEVDI